MKIITVEDHGQDFLRLYLDKHHVIVDAQPFQGRAWKGVQVLQKRIRAGMRLRLRRRGEKPMILKYPVVSVSRLAEAR